MRSIKSRVILYFVIIILFVVVILGSLFMGTVWQYYYGSVTRSLAVKSSYSISFYNKNLEYASLAQKSRFIIENSPADQEVRTEIIDLDGTVVMESYGIHSMAKVKTPDVRAAYKGEQGTWIGNNEETGEKTLALSSPLMEDDRVVGVLRYSTSLELLEQTLWKYFFLTSAIGLGVVALSIAASLFMTGTIVKPIRELTAVAKAFARGEYKIKAVKRHPDEIGELADTMNYMSSEILRNEQIKNDFISSISHELRTPLTAIKGWNETLVSGDGHNQEETQMGLRIIAQETDRLIGLVEDLLDFSKLQSRAIQFQPEEVELNHIVEEVSRQYTAACAARNLNLVVHLNAEPLRTIGEYNRLKQILINLVDNAIKFTPENGSIELATVETPSMYEIHVKDSGEGIPPEDLKYVKDKFFKGSSRRSGSGLGLSISNELARLHGGQIDIRSVLGEGTEVIILLPKRIEG
ncbi:sensor histidine kinase [Paenibacillus albiflavus]|nr:HAMP domain-containing sensor histidine kinase [Paenibacillus albiflavus]